MKFLHGWVILLVVSQAVVHGSGSNSTTHQARKRSQNRIDNHHPLATNGHIPPVPKDARRMGMNGIHHQDQRELQREAQLCTENPTPFATSIFTTFVGDNTPFTEADLNTTLGLVLQTYKEININQCDPTYRTLQRVSVGDVF